MSNSSSNDNTLLSQDASPTSCIRVDTSREIDVELVGLHCGSNGRSCCSHKIYGQHVIPGDMLRLVLTVVEVDDEV
jgi:hypothetical protein